ncbi:hypothetical protein HYQ46_003091 [Verticillium longisporum]|nr:hypothetical protein HYQ46_003091 [Verticillium longisporum]
MSQLEARPLLSGKITLSEAIDDESDVLRKLSYPEKRLDFYQFLQAHAREKRIAIRFPLPYKIGESTNQGNAEEKLRCEVATYAWIQAHCPSIPIPRLWGFCFPGESSFTSLFRTPLLSRLSWYIRWSIRWRHTSVMLSLAQVQFPRIGSLTMDNYGVVSLANRPLGLHLHQLENDEISTEIPRNLTYATTDTYLLDRLSCHDNRIRYQPNSIFNQSDGESQISSLTIMRALMPHFTQKEGRHGPFILMLTDLHPSNIFVDGDGHVTCVIDLERACTLPVEMLQPPYWLTNRAVDQITGDSLVDYRERHNEFISAFQAEEEACGSITSYAEMMRKSWDLGSFWYFNAIESLSGFYNLFLQHIQPRYGPEAVKGWKDFERSVTPYWSAGMTRFIVRKVHEREQYLQRLREVFQQASEGNV